MKRTIGLILIGLSLLFGLSQGARAYTNKYINDPPSIVGGCSANYMEPNNCHYSSEGYFYRLIDQDYVYARVSLLSWAHNWETGYWGGNGGKGDQYAQMVKTTIYRYDGPAGSEPGVTITPKYAGWGQVDLASCIIHVYQGRYIMFDGESRGPTMPTPLPMYAYAESHGRSMGVGSAVGAEKVKASTELCSFAQQPTFITPSYDEILVYRPGQHLDVPSFPPPQNYQDATEYFDGVAGRGIPDVLVPDSSSPTSMVCAGIIEGDTDVRSGGGDLTCNRYGFWRIGKWSRSGSECTTPWLYDANAPWPNTPNADPNNPSYQDPWYSATPVTISNWWTPTPIEIPAGTANFVITAEADAHISSLGTNAVCGRSYQEVGQVYYNPFSLGYETYATGDVAAWAGGGARATMKAELCIY